MESLPATASPAPMATSERFLASDTPPIDRPARIGPYLVRKVLGSGGMATVYLADQIEPVRRRVALKVTRPASVARDLLPRFQLEIQALSVLTHPNIAGMLDVGSTEDGVVYFAMEYVPGMHITDYADAHALPVKDRLALLIQVANAVHYMHEKGIIHRDLKPSNILIVDVDGAPAAKVIDLGVAKMTEACLAYSGDVTIAGEFLGTPVYVSPEQASGRVELVDVRADVYSLGMLAYELLVGELPFDRTLATRDLPTFLELLTRGEIPHPSTRFLQLGERGQAIARARGLTRAALMRELQGELGWIVSKALAKERDRRYATVRGLRDDLERFLRHEPVEARAPSASYRVAKFVRRNRGGLAMLGTTLAALVLGAAASTWWYLDARAEDAARVALVRQLDTIETTLANAHLWLEEAVSGDTSVDVTRDVEAPIREALALAVQARDSFAEADPGSPEARSADALRRVAAETERWALAAEGRWRERLDRGRTGKGLDQEFDAAYQRIIGTCKEAEHDLESAVHASWRRFSYASIGVNGAVAVLLAGLTLIGFRARAFALRSSRSS